MTPQVPGQRLQLGNLRPHRFWGELKNVQKYNLKNVEELCEGPVVFFKEVKLVFIAHALMENRNGMLVDFQTTQVTGTVERDAMQVR
jgi:hypothetical protein